MRLCALVDGANSGYSHADRVTDESLLQLERIQQTICEGKDIFGMLPEAYKVRPFVHLGVELVSNVSQWKDLLALMDKDA